MECAVVSDNRPRRKLRSSDTSTIHLNYSEILDNLPVDNELLNEHSRPRKRAKRSSNKTKKTFISKCDPCLQEIISNGAEKNNSLKLFPIFAVSNSLKPSPGLSDEKIFNQAELACTSKNSTSCEEGDRNQENGECSKRKRKKVKNIKHLDSLVTTIKPVSIKNLRKSAEFENLPNSADVTKEIQNKNGTLKLFPIFSNSHTLVEVNKTAKKSPVKSEVVKLCEKNNCLSLKQPSMELQSSPIKIETSLSSGILDNHSMNSPEINIAEDLNVSVGEQASSIKRKISTETIRKTSRKVALKSSPCIEDVPTDTLTPISTSVKCMPSRRQKSATNENTISTRLTRSHTKKESSKSESMKTALPDEIPQLPIEVANKTEIKIKKNFQEGKRKVKPDVLKLLPQSCASLKKMKHKSAGRLKNSTNPAKVKLFPLFDKQFDTLPKKQVAEKLNSVARKRISCKQKSDKISNLIEQDVNIKTASGNTTEVGDKLKSFKNTNIVRNNVIFSQKSKVGKLQKISAESDDSIEEIKIIIDEQENIDRKPKCSENPKESNKVEIFKDKAKIVDNYSFPLYSHCNQFNSSTKNLTIPNYAFKMEKNDDVMVPSWNSLKGITDIKIIQETINTSIIASAPSTNDEPTIEVENRLWTDINNDYNLKDGISESTISELNAWLLQWKSKFSKGSKHKKIDKDDSYDGFSSDSDDSDCLSNSVIIEGLPGSGKTSLVYSLAHDHGFKVLEVNASSCRSGRNISHQLKEALESYHVEQMKSSDVILDKDKKANLSAALDSDFSKNANVKTKKRGIAKFFQKETDVKVEDTNKASSLKNFFKVKPSLTDTTKSHSKKNKKLSKTKETKAQKVMEAPKDLCSISTLTIILFDDMDVVFQEDEGLWSTIRGFLKISKKPVIFTVSRSLAVVTSHLEPDIRVLHLKPMVKELVTDKLDFQCKKYNRDDGNLNKKLLACHSNDIRRSLLHAQFWSRSSTCNKASTGSCEKFVNINTFTLGSKGVADFKAFVLNEKEAINVLSEYHRIGYDILHGNIFKICNVICNIEKKWRCVTSSCPTQNEANYEENSDSSETSNKPVETNLWQEACAVFESKKRALRTGSCSSDLFLFSNILEDHSFVDTLKGHYCKNMNWLPLSERVEKWTLGLPVCNNHDSTNCSDFILDAISSIQVLGFQTSLVRYAHKSDSTQDETSIPALDVTDFSINWKSLHELKLKIIASVLPASHILNRNYLSMDYLSILKVMCQFELERQTKSGKRSNRFLHYFDSISFLIDKFQIEQIMEI